MKLIEHEDGVEVGQIVIRKAGSKYNLTDFYVAPKYRRKGYGKKLLKKAMAYADKKGLELTLRIAPYGKEAMSRNKLITLYRRFGFIIIDTVKMVRISHERRRNEVPKEHRSSG